MLEVRGLLLRGRFGDGGQGLCAELHVGGGVEGGIGARVALGLALVRVGVGGVVFEADLFEVGGVGENALAVGAEGP